MSKTKKLRLAPVILWIGLLTSPALAQDAATAAGPSLFETLQRSDVLQMTLITDQKKLIREKEAEEYQPATLQYQDANGKPVVREIEVKTRGNMRLKTCYYPPLRIKISKDDVKTEGLKPLRKLKLVVGCKPGSEYEQLVLREYLTYRINNLLTDQSFQVQLVSLQMLDSEEKEKPRETLAFIIEDEDELAERLGGQMIEPSSMSRNALEKGSYDLLSLFQFVVGNTDWFVLNSHNTKFVRTHDPPSIIPIAYDFDFAGLVNSPYAVPNDKMPIKSVTERFYIGACRDEAEYKMAVEHVLSKKAEIMALADEVDSLSDRSRDYVIKYLTKSFDILENPKMRKREFKRGCDWTPGLK